MPSLLLSIALLASIDRPDILIADFDGPDYGAWKLDGTAFGAAPAPGTLPNQMPVGGFKGKGLVNSYLGGDDSTGTLTSPPFRIERHRINFLIGGGNHPGETCINLIINGETARTETGNNSEYLRPASWDVAEFEGKDAQIVIVDTRRDGWGHINIDQIVQSDSEPPVVDERTELLARADDSVAVAAEKVKDDPSRPTFHILPPANWINDPNGLLYHNGYYHVFYQHNPYGDDWGHMHWGHVRSKDLVRWEHLPIALWPSKSKGEDHVFSGSAWVRKDGTPILFYTSIGANRLPEQWAAIPEDDDLIKWKKHPANPILTEAIHGDTKIHEWRDPYLFDINGVVHMVVGGNTNNNQGGGGVVCVYRADNDELTKWTYLGVLFKHPDAEVKNIECPIFFKLDGRWVLIVSQGQPVDWFVGDLDEKTMRFTPQTRGKVDYGQVYAPSVLVQNVERPILWGWINGVPGGKGWRHSLTIPRELSVSRDGRLLQRPSNALSALRKGAGASVTTLDASKPIEFDLEQSGPSRSWWTLSIQTDEGNTETAGIVATASNDPNARLPILYDGAALTVGTTRVPYPAPRDRIVSLNILVDGPIVEVSTSDAEVWVTQFSDLLAREYSVKAQNVPTARVFNLKLMDVGSIWANPAGP